MSEAIILDLDSTLLNAYGKQEGRAFNFHYQSNGYHPLVCYDGLTGDLIKIQLRDGTQCSSTMENFIKESKIGFDFASVSSHARIVNANRLQIHALAYNIFNWFRRPALSANMRKQRIDTVRLKLLKIAAKVIRSARYITFKLCSSCPYKGEFYKTLSNISKLCIQLE